MSDTEAFRQEVREWLAANCPPSLRGPMAEDEVVWGGSQVEFKNDDQRLWFERMRDRGWFCPDWPREYDGGGLNAEETHVLEREMRRLDCRPPQINLGIWMLGPVLLEYGTEEQKKRHLPGMARGEVRWCQGFSEPSAGSDLANIRTLARDGGDHYIVNGSKIWTSYGDKSDWMYALVRTNDQVPKREGISLVLLDMHAPGVSVEPIDLISGKSAFCQVFFEDVRVGKMDLIGEPDRGWPLAKRLLQHERGAMSKFGEISLPNHFDLMNWVNEYLPAPRGPAAALTYGRANGAAMDEHAYNLTVQRMGEMARAGEDVSGLGAIMKLVHTEQERVKFDILLEAMGYRALGWQGEPFIERELALTRTWANSYTLTIAGGTSEVQLNVIAKRVLGLPEAGKGVKS
jgi:alkylation response protein AidB-like acyl-CoA dehydrogenase